MGWHVLFTISGVFWGCGGKDEEVEEREGVFLSTLFKDLSFCIATSFDGTVFEIAGGVVGFWSGETSAGGELICFLVIWTGLGCNDWNALIPNSSRLITWPLLTTILIEIAANPKKGMM